MENINKTSHLGEGRNIIVMRHFDEIDDLEKYGRDGVLSEGQEEKAEKAADLLLAEIKKHNKKAVLFITSPRVRANQTAQMITDILLKKDPALKCSCVQENDLRAIDQGEFVLPTDYVRGQKYEGLLLADQAFFNETHASDNRVGVDNYNYKFGDPVLLENGRYKYPELVGFFTQYGETYKEVLLRLYSLIIKTSEKVYKLGKNIELVIVTHGQPAQIFKDLKKVAELIKNDAVKYKEGELAKLCWEFYKKRDAAEKVTGSVDVISVEELTDPDLVGLLKREILFLKNE